MSGSVQVYVDGKPYGQSLNLAVGDSVQFTMPGKLLNGALTIAEERIATYEQTFRKAAKRIDELQELLWKMAQAGSLEEVAGIAWRARELREEPW